MRQGFSTPGGLWGKQTIFGWGDRTIFGWAIEGSFDSPIIRQGINSLPHS